MRLWHKITIALVLLALIPLAIATYQVVTKGARELSDSARAYHIATADVALGSLEAMLRESVSEVKTIGAALAQPEVEEDDRIRTARAQLIGSRRLHTVSIYRPDGKLIDTMRAPRDEGEGVLPPPEELREDERRIAEEEGYLFRDVIRRDDGVPLLPLVVPIHKGVQRKLYMYIFTVLEVDHLSEEVGQLSARRFAGRQDLVHIVDGKLRVIGTFVKEQLWREIAGKEAFVDDAVGTSPFAQEVARTTDYTREDGLRVIGAVVPNTQLGWGVVVEQSRDEAYAAVADTWRTAIIIGSIFGLLAILLGLFVGRRLAKPVSNVADAAKRVAGGDFDVRVDSKSNDEVGQMANSFNDMARDLGDYRDKLIEETRVRSNLSRFLSPEVVDAVIVGQDQLELGGERRKITVLFADVVSFTTLADEHDPEFVVGILNELFTIITEIVFKHGGIIDKFIGDCAMAVFGAPEEHEDDAARAVRAAEEMLRWLEVGNAKWRKELGRELQLAIGINTGYAVVGNVGSEKRMEYTAIGDVVNVAARLERLARPGQILMTREVMAQVSEEFDSLSLGSYNLIGRSRPSEIFVLDE